MRLTFIKFFGAPFMTYTHVTKFLAILLDKQNKNLPTLAYQFGVSKPYQVFLFS